MSEYQWIDITNILTTELNQFFHDYYSAKLLIYRRHRPDHFRELVSSLESEKNQWRRLHHPEKGILLCRDTHGSSGGNCYVDLWWQERENSFIVEYSGKSWSPPDPDATVRRFENFQEAMIYYFVHSPHARINYWTNGKQ